MKKHNPIQVFAGWIFIADIMLVFLLIWAFSWQLLATIIWIFIVAVIISNAGRKHDKKKVERVGKKVRRR